MISSATALGAKGFRVKAADRSRGSKRPDTKNDATGARLPGQVVLVLQGGGALGAYQVGVYEALQEAGIEPDWVIGTSIGAINGALIAGNRTKNRMPRLRAFWAHVEQDAGQDYLRSWIGLGNIHVNLSTVFRGIDRFFVPNLAAWFGAHAPLGIDNAAYYSTRPLRETLSELVEFDCNNNGRSRLTVGAVNARTGEMRYFDSRDQPITLDQIMASGALPPAFPAVRIDGDPYWDGGLYSNTPIEAVLDDNPRRDSVIFMVNVWNPNGPEPRSVWDVMGRTKDIQYASRAKSHIARQKQIHHLRHVIRELASRLPGNARQSDEVRKLAAWGCGTTMHVVRLDAPMLDAEDHTKDIDFTRDGIRLRWRAGLHDTRRMLERSPWNTPVDPIEGVVIHESPGAGMHVAKGVDGFEGQTR